jgi:hypothetical protein
MGLILILAELNAFLNSCLSFVQGLTVEVSGTYYGKRLLVLTRKIGMWGKFFVK